MNLSKLVQRVFNPSRYYREKNQLRERKEAEEARIQALVEETANLRQRVQELQGAYAPYDNGASNALLQRARFIEPGESYVQASTTADTFLVEFPKSGVTWFSFLVGNTNLILSKHPARVTWFNIGSFIHDIYISQKVPDPLPVPGSRIFKSHAMYRPEYSQLYNGAYCKVIYLVRDPRSALSSYYYFLSKLGSFPGTMDDFLASDQGARSWKEHVESWTKQPPSFRIHFLRYEDLRSDTAGALRRIYKLCFGIEVPPKVLKEAVELSDLAHMRQAEMDYAEYASAALPPDFDFVRPGEPTEPRVPLTDKQRAYIEEVCGDAMRKFHYLPQT
ncbi:hypothetical protein DB346_07205 [Verrucomicrobia bacterium LW23]|nr:hypothetical protein DB346_07205 [Verrucomicrobia bacterium LW23]